MQNSKVPNNSQSNCLQEAGQCQSSATTSYVTCTTKSNEGDFVEQNGLITRNICCRKPLRHPIVPVSQSFNEGFATASLDRRASKNK